MFVDRICKLLIYKYLILSGYRDSNAGPPAPKAGALANCATPRKGLQIYMVFVNPQKIVYLSDMIVQAHNICKSFGNLKVLKGIDLSVAPREVVSIMGASGAGKSTLLQILGTLSTPDEGSLSIDGTDVLKLDGKSLSAFRNRRIGFVFQFHHLLPEFTAVENVMIPALIGGTSARDARNKALGLLDRLGLSERTEHKPSQLSGGEQQRVAIARALVNDPAVLFADEPSGNLDSVTKTSLHELFFQLREDLGQTIIIVTHDDGLARMCDRTLLIRDGLIDG